MPDETTAFINSNNWLEITLGKFISEKDYIHLITLVYDLALELEDKDYPVMLLVDCSGQEDMEEMAEKHAVKGTRDLHFNKIASFGLKPKFIPLLSTIVTETGNAEIKDFPTRAEAVDWLQS
ncbi:MAG: STAS/SEC14 domain-containing protein [Candidatus Dojkabacteria bacterium]